MPFTIPLPQISCNIMYMSATIFSNCIKPSILNPWTCDKHHSHKKVIKLHEIPTTTWDTKMINHVGANTVVLLYSSHGKKTLGLIGTKVPDISPFLPIHTWTLHHLWPTATCLYCLLIVKISTNIQVKISSLEQIWTASNHEPSFHSNSKAVTQIISIVYLWSYATSSNWTQRQRVSWNQHMNTF
jgi:hypothetical protein